MLSSRRDICWNAHDDGIVASKIDHPERRDRFDLDITANKKLVLGDRQITDDPIALVVEHGFEKADPDSLVEVEYAKAMGGDPLSRIAETTRRFAESERIRLPIVGTRAYSASMTRSPSIQVSRKARERLSKTGFMMYSKNVRSPVLM